MKNHLKNKHPEQFATVSAGIAKIKITTTVTLATNAPVASGSSLVPSHERLPLKETLERKQLWDINNKKFKSYHYLIAEMIALDNEPYSIVERIGFTRLMQKAVPQFKMPSCSYIIEKIMPDIFDRIHTKIRINISQAAVVSITSDIWTCLQDNVSYLNFTAHWLSPEIALEHGVLSTKPFTGSYNGENIAKEFNNIAQKWDIPQSKIHLLIHNTIVDVTKCEHSVSLDLARCFINSLQQAIDESFRSQSDVMEMLDDARRIVAHFNQSVIAQGKLKAIRQEMNLPDNQLMQDISTRWVATYYLMERLLEQKRAVSLYVTDHDYLKNLTRCQWQLIEECFRLLKPFEEITKITSSGLSCISEVIPHINTLIKYLEKEEIADRTTNISNVRSTLRCELEKRFENENHDKYLVATFLDPMFKTNFLEIDKVERAKHFIHLRALKLGCHEPSTSDESPPPAKKIHASDNNLSIEKHHSFWNCFDEVATSNIKTERIDEISVESEIEYYLKTIRVDRKADPYKWWSENAKQYPILTKLVKIYLSSPSSSIYNESFYSEPGLVYEEKRNLLLTTNTEKLIFIHKNLPLVDYNY